MARSVSRALSRNKDDLREHLCDELIEGACRAAGHRLRKRKFGPVETIHLFVLQVLAFNTAITHLRHLSGQAVNAAAYCKARMRLALSYTPVVRFMPADKMDVTGCHLFGSTFSTPIGNARGLVLGIDDRDRTVRAVVDRCRSEKQWVDSDDVRAESGVFSRRRSQAVRGSDLTRYRFSIFANEHSALRITDC